MAWRGVARRFVLEVAIGKEVQCLLVQRPNLGEIAIDGSVLFLLGYCNALRCDELVPMAPSSSVSFVTFTRTSLVFLGSGPCFSRIS